MSSLTSSAHGASRSDVAPQSWPPHRILASSYGDQAQARLDAIMTLGLDEHRSIPAFEEAIQLVREHFGMPVGWISVALEGTEYLRATYGLSSLGLGNPLAEERKLPLAASLSGYVLDRQQPWAIDDVTHLDNLSATSMMATYGLMAYGAVPLTTSQHQCIGVLAIMDRQPREFSPQDISFLAMAARWGMGEYERQRAMVTAVGQTQPTQTHPFAVDAIRLHLMGHLIQDMRNPLTAVLGMTSMLSREIYGPLTEKQREYVDIVRNSSQTLMNQVDEILDLGLISPESNDLVAAPVDIHRLGHQVLETLAPLAETLSQTLDFTVEPTQGLWILDQHTVKQVFYHGVFSLMHMASENSILRIHSSRKGQSLALALWVSNPWLGEGLPSSMVHLCQSLEQGDGCHRLEADLHAQGLRGNSLTPADLSKQWLGMILCHHLAQHHGGHMRLQGSAEAGYRLVITLPALGTKSPRIDNAAAALAPTDPSENSEANGASSP
jgi:signal transduction histidine kinase